MEGFILAAMALMLLALTALVLVGGRGWQKRDAGLTPAPRRWPRVGLTVPVAGADGDLAGRLSSLLAQDYPDYEVVLVTRDLKDPATPAILAVISGCPRARQVVSGPAVSCSQKNHNLLAGIRALGEAPEVLAFCDANQSAPAHFLTELVRPIALGEAQVTGGYQHVIPGDARLATLGRAISVLTLYLVKGVACLDQPWGGATAISRGAFADLAVERLWAENVVDDVSLAARLLEAGMRVRLAPGAVLAAPLAGETLAGWSRWLTRQWLYLKFCLPGSWVAAGMFSFLLLGLVMLAGGRLLLAPWGWVSAGPALGGGLFLALVTALGVAMRRLHPRPGPLLAWIGAFYAAVAMSGWSHLGTWFTRTLNWRGFSYRVARKGKVTEIRPDPKTMTKEA